MIVIGLFGLARATSLFLEPNEGLLLGLWSLGGLMIVLHATWLHALHRDGQLHLTAPLPFDARRVTMILFLSCIFAALFTVFALRLLLRITQAEIESRDSLLGRALLRFREETKVLYIMAGLELLVTMISQVAMASRADQLGSGALERTSVEGLLGTAGALMLALFSITVSSCYLWFAIRATPVLYRGYARLAAARQMPEDPVRRPSA